MTNAFKEDGTDYDVKFENMGVAKQINLQAKANISIKRKDSMVNSDYDKPQRKASNEFAVSDMIGTPGATDAPAFFENVPKRLMQNMYKSMGKDLLPVNEKPKLPENHN